MGKYVDTAIIGILSFCLSVVLFHMTGKSAPAIIGISFIFAISIMTVFRRLLQKKKVRITGSRKRSLSDKRIKSLVYLDPVKAHEAVFELLTQKYPVSQPEFIDGHMKFTHADSENAILYVIQKLKVSQDDILAAWRMHGKERGARSVVIAVPGKSDNEIRVIAARLKNPDVIVLSRNRLIALNRKYGKNEAPDVRMHRLRPIQALSCYVTRRRALKYLLYAAFLMLYYLSSGKIMYLVFSSFLLLISLFCLSKPKEPENLI